MTLIAFAAAERSADIITDTASYAMNLRQMGHTTKVTPLAHIDTALMTQGDARFGYVINNVVHDIANQAPDLDAVLDELPDKAFELWPEITKGAPADWVEGTIFLVGYSPTAGRFVAYGLAAETDFEPWQIDGLHVMPSPMTMRPSDLELGRAEKAGIARDVIDHWRTLRPPVVPANASRWLQLGLDVRRQCFGAPGNLKTAVAGHLVHTHISRGKVSSKRIHTFDDSGPEFQSMIAGTLHPQSQLGPCLCGSGKRFLDCHLAAHLEKPCPCGAKKPLAECCAEATLNETRQLA